MNKRNRLTVGMIATIILLACACPATSLTPIAEEPTTSIPVIPTEPDIPIIPTIETSSALLRDDFSVPSAELETFSDDSGSAETKDGVYVVRSTGELWNWGASTSEFNDTVIEFDTTTTIAPANNNAGSGVICRMHAREDNSIDGYLLAISADGFYSIRSIVSSSMDPLVDWTYSDTINQGNLENTIRATCNGSELILEVNGEVLATASATADGPTSGAIAFAAVSFETGEPLAEVHYDNLVVSAP
ncbi:MAG: hypothetical protein H7Y59_13525 [Anaerolineales bacterium]|nr:hypothetical protein [Anaerolineales bacterium]